MAVMLTVMALLYALQGLPFLLVMRKPGSLRCWFEDPAEAQERTRHSPELQEWIGRLKALGFDELGVKVEKMPLWGGSYREVALVSQESDIYASIVMRNNGSPASLYYYTPLHGGGMIFTRNFGDGPEFEGDGVSVQNVPSGDFAFVLDVHTRRLDTFRERGRMPRVAASQAARVEATHAFYAGEYARRNSIRVSTGIAGCVAALAILGCIAIGVLTYLLGRR
jgi:hypothetical protein